ncbi:MAG: phosphoribosylanthranilate isomerase [Chloroflexi bacterium]|nr:phosphoribosylanthranilate isomerase [Chloroflexota bacterium]
MTYVKICGVRDAATAAEVVKAGADFVGIMFAQSKRRVTPQETHEIVEAVRAGRRTPPPATYEAPSVGEVRGLSWFGAWSEAIEQALFRWRPLVVGVFADQTSDEVNDIADAAGLDLVQLSGGESTEFVRRIGWPVVRAVHMQPETLAEDVYETINGMPAAGVLLDTGSATLRGGTGETFDWAIAAEVAARLPFLLAGGLDPVNVAEAVAQVQPWGVDVSSGVETGGVKDMEKVRAFIRAAKGTSNGR